MKAAIEKSSTVKEAVLERLNWRYATKKYDPARGISDEDWAVLEESLILAPSSFGLQPYKFIVVKDPEVREQLRAAAFGQPQITEASHLVVLAYKKTYTDSDIEALIDHVAAVRGQSRDSLADYEKSIKAAMKSKTEDGTLESWASRQPYIAVGFMIETAALMGIDTSPMEGFDPEKFNEILGLEDYSAVVVCAAGYRHPEGDWLAPLPKVRLPKKQLIKYV